MSQERPVQPLLHRTALVTGASRGFGAAIAEALCAAGADVVGVARSFTRTSLETPLVGPSSGSATGSFVGVRGDATDPDLAQRLLARVRPDIVVLNAGARPPTAVVSEQDWESFSVNWNSDTRQAFEWTTAALRLPLAPGAIVIGVSSGAAIAGSPLSGGYAPAKAAMRFLRNYADAEASRSALDIRFVTLLPQLTPLTDLGRAAADAYADYHGLSPEQYVESLGPLVSPSGVGRAVVEIVEHADPSAEYLVSGGGLRPLPIA